MYAKAVAAACGLLLVVGLGLVGGASFGLLGTPAAPAVTEAYGIVSQCGVHGIVSVRSDGTTIFYDGRNPPTPAEQEVINSLPESSRTTIVVPCSPPVSSIPNRREIA